MTPQQTPAAAMLPLERLKRETCSGQQKPGTGHCPSRASPQSASHPQALSFVLQLLCFLPGNGTTVRDRKGGRLAEVSCPFIGTLVKFLLKNSLWASQNHRKGGIFHVLTEQQGSAKRKGGWGAGTASREQGIMARDRLAVC